MWPWSSRGDNLWLLIDDPSALTTEHPQPPPIRGLVCQAPSVNGNQSSPTVALQAGDFFVSMSSDRPVTAELIVLAAPVVKRLVVDFSEIDPQHADMSCFVWIGAMRNLEACAPHSHISSVFFLCKMTRSPRMLAGAVDDALSVWQASGRNLLSGQAE